MTSQVLKLFYIWWNRNKTCNDICVWTSLVNVALPCQLVLFRFYTGYHLQLPTNKTSFPTFIFLWSKFQTQTQKYVKLRSAHTEPHRMQTFIVRLYMKICLNSMSKTSDFCNTRKSSGQPPFALSMNCANISRNFFVEWIVLFVFFLLARPKYPKNGLYFWKWPIFDNVKPTQIL